jgi:hypothetical protein
MTTKSAVGNRPAFVDAPAHVTSFTSKMIRSHSPAAMSIGFAGFG